MLDQNVPNPLAKNPNFHTHKVFAAIGIILIVIIIIGGGIWYIVQSSEDKNPTATDSVTVTKVSTNSAKKSTKSAEKNETADWKTYTNSHNGNKFSFKYPQDWLTEVAVVDQQANNINYVVKKADKSVAFLNQRNRGSQITGPNVLDMYEMKTSEVEFLGKKVKVTEFIPKNTGAWEIFPQNNENQELFSFDLNSNTLPSSAERIEMLLILSTFKLL